MSDYTYYRRSSVLLNWDVILHLANFLSRSTLISLMSTCKDLRRHGVRIILGEDRAIAFWTLSDVRSLTAFMNSNVPEGTGGRSAHIRMVDLASKVQQWTHDEMALNRLVDLLKQATNLYALSVNHTFFRFSSVAQSMCASPSPFRSLRRLRLESPTRINLATNVATAAGAQQVNPATSPYFLEKLAGIPLEVVIVSSFQSRRAELIGQLYRFRETLQELHVEETNLFLVPGAFNVTIVFPKLRVLSVTHSSNLALPRHTDTLIEMFPNIHSLAFSVPASTRTGRAAAGFAVHPNAPFGWQAIPFDGENALVPAPHTQTTIRDGNESGQRLARWNTLSYYQGSLEQLYMLAVRSHVEQLKITDLALTSTRVEWMHVVVRELAPTKLCLVLTVPDPVPDNADVELINLMPRDPTRPLRYLEIQLLNWPVEGEKLQSQLRLLCLAMGTVRTLVIKLLEKVVMKYKNPRDVEAAHEESENFVIQTAQTSRSLRHIGLPNDLFGPLPNLPAEEGKSWLAPVPAPKETFFWSIEHDDDSGMIYADKLSKKATASLLEFETSPVVSTPF